MSLSAWTNALSSGSATAVIIGDSISEGIGASTVLNRWQSLLQTSLRNGSPGALFPFLPAWSTAGSNVPVVLAGSYGSATTAGLGGKGIQMGSTASVTFTFTGTSATVLWSTFTTSRALSVTVDGGVPVILSGVGTSVLPAVETATWSTGPLTRGVHVVVVTRGSAVEAANPVLNGLLTFDGDEATGVRVIDSARSGSTSGALGDPVRAASLGQGLAAAGGADLAVIGFGTNDYAVGPVTPAQFRTNLEAIIAGLRSHGFTGSILLLGMYMSQGRTLSTWQQYLDEMADLAALDSSIDFLNLRESMPDIPTPYTAPEGEGLYADALHPSDAGHARIASSVLDEITPGLFVVPVLGAPCPRVEITLTGLDQVGPSRVTVWRSTVGGKRRAVRGWKNRLVFGSDIGIDYEAPLGREIRYDLQVISGAGTPLRVTATCTLAATEGLIQDPLVPGSNVPLVDFSGSGIPTPTLAPSAFRKLTYDMGSSQERVLGSDTPVGFAGQRMVAAGVDFSTLTDSAEQGTALRNLLMTAYPVLVRPLPEWGDLPDLLYLDVPQPTEEPLNAHTGGTLTRWTLAGDQVTPPALSVVVPLWTYDQVQDLFAAYTYAYRESLAVGINATYMDDQRDPTLGG